MPSALSNTKKASVPERQHAETKLSVLSEGKASKDRWCTGEEKRERGGNHGSPRRGWMQQAESSSNGYSEKIKKSIYRERGQSLSSFIELGVFEMSDGGGNERNLKPVK